MLLVFFYGAIAVQSTPTSASAIISSDEEMPYEDSDTEKPCENQESIAKTECHLASSQVCSLLHCSLHVQHVEAPVGADDFGRNLVNAIHRLRI